MKKFFAISTLAVFTALSSAALAASVDVDSIDADQEGTTTIQIKKSKNDKSEDSKPTSDARWHVEDGTQDLEGEPSATAKEARAAWKKSCEDWKKEFRADNKENKIIAISCGAATCGGDAGSKTCTSKASFKIKTRVD